MMESTMPVETRRRRAWFGALAVATAAIVATVALSGDSDGTSSSASPVPPVEDARGPIVPNAEFVFFDGSVGTLSGYRGKPLVINFWASWCPPCVAEMSAAFLPVQERLGDTVSFVGFNIQDDRSRALALVEETGVLFDLAEDADGDLYTELGGFGMPFTVFVSPTGEVIAKHNGPLTEGQLEDLIKENLLDT